MRQDSTILKARVELFDQMGDPVKAIGHFRFDLYREGGQSAGSLAKRLYTWHVSTLTLDTQSQFYESVSRTYLFVLDLGQWRPQRGVALQVTFTSSLGNRLEATVLLDGGYPSPRLSVPSGPPIPVRPAIQPKHSAPARKTP